MARYELTIIGNNRFAADLAASLVDDGLAPDLIVTLGERGRSQAAIAGAHDSLATWARDLGISVYETDGFRLQSERDREFFRDSSFDLGVCTDWQHLIPAHVLQVFDGGIFGFHGSHMELPNGRGRSPFNWSIRLDAKLIHHNCFRYSEGADEGGVFRTTQIPIGTEDDIRLVQLKALADYRVTIRDLVTAHRSGRLSLTPQSESASVWLPKLTPADSRLQFAALSTLQALNIIRASARPFAGAFAETADGVRTIVWRASRYDGPVDPKWTDVPVGAVLIAALDCLLIKCRDGLLVASEVSTERNVELLAGQVFL